MRDYLHPILLVAALATYTTLGYGADLARGKKLHDERCLVCHDTSNYEGVRSKIKSIDDLRGMVKRWEGKMRAPFNPDEREDVVAYLNAVFYKFSVPNNAATQSRNSLAAR